MALKRATKCHLLSLPNELLFLVADYLKSNDVARLIRTSKYMHWLLDTYLYSRTVRARDYYFGVMHASVNNQPKTISKFLREGTKFYGAEFYDLDTTEACNEFLRYPMKCINDQYPPKHPLLAAARLGYIEVVELLLNSGGDINFRIDLPPHCHIACTALLHAIDGRQTEMVRLLVSRGASLAVYKKRYGVLPLQFAAKIGFEDAVKILLAGLREGHYSKRTIRSQCQRACYAAVEMGRVEIVRFFLLDGLDLNFTKRDKSLLLGYVSHRV